MRMGGHRLELLRASSGGLGCLLSVQPKGLRIVSSHYFYYLFMTNHFHIPSLHDQLPSHNYANSDKWQLSIPSQQPDNPNPEKDSNSPFSICMPAAKQIASPWDAPWRLSVTNLHSHFFSTSKPLITHHIYKSTKWAATAEAKAESSSGIPCQNNSYRSGTVNFPTQSDEMCVDEWFGY